MHSAARITTARRKTPRIPRLRHGDRLSIEEFERRYDAMPELKKAELIEGVVYMSSAVRFDGHGSQHAHLVAWLGYYEAFTPGVQAGVDSSVNLRVGLNRPQPDSLLRIVDPEAGQSSTTEKGYVAGAPEFAGEITASTGDYDLHEKLHAYERNGVREYLVWRVQDSEIDWFILRGAKYRRLPRSKDGIYRSKVFPGLWLHVEAMLDGDLRRVLGVVQQGIDSPEHEAFAERLRPRRRK